jgi:IMP and pyridine-specific 5'-nucleotidase
MKSMLQHSFVLDALETTGADTFSHFEVLMEEHRVLGDSLQPSRLQQLVPTIGTFHTNLPLREAFLVYNEKHRLTKRKHIQISFNEIRQILDLAQIMAMRDDTSSPAHKNMMSLADFPTVDNADEENGDDDLELALKGGQLNGPRLISFDGDQTLYSDGANFEENPKLANYLYLLLRHGVFVAVVTAAGYGYVPEKYEFRLSGLLKYFAKRGLTPEECEHFYLFGGECNYLLRLGSDYRLHPVREHGPGGWYTSTKHLSDGPSNWAESKVDSLLDVADNTFQHVVEELNLRGRVIRKSRSVGLVPEPGQEITRESLDETVLRVHEKIHMLNNGTGPGLPYCAFNGGTDAWVDVGNKRVGVQVLQSFLGVAPEKTLHIGDQFLNTGNDYAARACAPCIWIINPKETTYILKVSELQEVPSIHLSSISRLSPIYTP